MMKLFRKLSSAFPETSTTLIQTPGFKALIDSPTKEAIATAALKCSIEFDLELRLILAVIEQESAFNVKARRYEPGFYDRYIKGKTRQRLGGAWPHNLSEITERHERSTSWGPMQIIGQTARERGFRGDFSDLLSPDQGIYWGCKELSRQVDLSHGNIPEALLGFNGGGNPDYPSQVLKRIK